MKSNPVLQRPIYREGASLPVSISPEYLSPELGKEIFLIIVRVFIISSSGKDDTIKMPARAKCPDPAFRSRRSRNMIRGPVSVGPPSSVHRRTLKPPS